MRRILRDIFIIFLLSLTPLLWFRPGMLMVGHDLVAPLNPQVFFAGRLITWINQFFGQSQAFILGTIPIHFVDAIPSYLGFNLETGQKIVYFIWFFFMGISAYVLAHVLRPKSSIFKLTAAILYQFNFFILQAWWIAEKSKFSAYIAAPLVLSVFLLVESGSVPVLIGAILNSMILFFFNAGGVYGLPLYGGFFVIIGSFILFSLIEHIYKKDFVSVRKTIVLVLSTLVLGLAINAYFVLPAGMEIRAHQSPDASQIGGVSGVLSWADEISANTSFLNLMRLEGIPDWYDNPEHPYSKIFLTNPILITMSFLWPLFTFATLYVVKDRKSYRIILYLFLVYLLGIFFAAGTHPPLGFIYQLLVEKIPAFFIFRTPYYKFVSALFFASAFLLAFFVDSIPVRMRKGCFIVFSIAVLGYHFPYFQGNFFSWRQGYSTRLAVPQYVFDFGKWLNAQHGQNRILMVPPDSPDLQYGLYHWGYLSFQLLPTLLSNDSVVVNNDKLNDKERILVMALYNSILKGDRESVSKFVSILGISHVLLTRDAVSSVTSSISLDTSQYAKGLKDTGLFTPEQTFGQWEVYGLKNQSTPRLYLVSRNPTIVDASLDDANLFLPKLPTNDFVVKSDTIDLSRIGIGGQVVIPNCITCPKKNRPEVVFPDRNILPGDPFYSFVLLSERLRSKPKDPKAAIYDSLGISLKRSSEMNQMIREKRVITQEVADRYIKLLDSIQNNFMNLSTLKDKFEVASDIQRYVRSERILLQPNFSALPDRTQTIITGNIFVSFLHIDKLLEPYIALIEDTNKPIYQFDTTISANWQIFMHDEELANIAHDPSALHISLDGNVTLNSLPQENSESDWIGFGQTNIASGWHTLQVVLPENIEQIYSLTSITTEFSQKDVNRCFGSIIPVTDHEKFYLLRLRYLNDFSNNLIMYGWENGIDNNSRLLLASRLLAGQFTEQTDQLLEVSPDARQITVAVCASDFSSERAAKQFALTIGQIIQPSLAIATVQNQPEQTTMVSYSSLSPDRYTVSMPQNTTYPTILVLSQRFDPWWELKGAPARHILINGFANGWLIESPVAKPLVIEYKAQKYFILGIALSLVTILAGIVGLFYWRRFHA